MAQKITQWLLISLVLTLGFGQLLRFTTPLGTLYAHDLLVSAILVINIPTILSHLRYTADDLKKSGIVLILGGLILGWLRALTLYPAYSLLTPFLYTVRLLAYLLLLSTVRKGKYTIPLRYFLVSGLVALSIGYLQYFAMPDMRWARVLGWDDHLNRLTMPHFDPTFSGVMLSLFALLAIDAKKYLFAVLAAPAVLLTYARSIWVSLLAAFVPRLRFVGVVIAALCVLGAALLLPKRFGEGTNLLRTFSISARYNEDASVVKNLGWNLITGVGLNTFSRSTLSEKGFPNHATGPNDSYLYILATCGVIGLIGWGIFLKDIYVHSHHKTSVLFILVASLFNNVLFYPFAMLWMFLLESENK